MPHDCTHGKLTGPNPTPRLTGTRKLWNNSLNAPVSYTHLYRVFLDWRCEESDRTALVSAVFAFCEGF